MFTIDHVFLCCSEGAPEAAALTRLGLTEGPANTHPGQGTACRRFFFENACLELIWVSDPAEAQSELVRETRLWERWSKRAAGACPFGIVLRPTGGSESREPPFPTWSYRPGYLPDGVSIELAVGTPIGEPELFYFPAARRPALLPNAVAHGLPVREITGLRIAIPGSPTRSAAAAALETSGLVSFPFADTHLMTLSLDREEPGRGPETGAAPRAPLVGRTPLSSTASSGMKGSNREGGRR